MNFNFQPPTTHFFPHKTMVLLKVVQPLKIHQHKNVYGRKLNGASFVSTSEV
jgi:hypothetical protein